MFKKILILACTSMLIFTMAACSGEEEEVEPGAIEAQPWAIAIDYGYPDEVEPTEDTTANTTAPTEAPTEVTTEAPTEVTTEAPDEEPTLEVVGQDGNKTEFVDEDGNTIIVEAEPTQPDTGKSEPIQSGGGSGNGSGNSGNSGDSASSGNQGKNNSNKGN